MNNVQLFQPPRYTNAAATQTCKLGLIGHLGPLPAPGPLLPHGYGCTRTPRALVDNAVKAEAVLQAS
jgi:hypothetical protein